MASASGFWGTYTLLVNKNPLEKRVNQIMRKHGMRKYKELLLTLNGVAAGEAALDSYPRVRHIDGVQGVGSMGGARPIETRTIIDRVSAAADVTAMNARLFTDTPFPVWVRDLSGNGGPAFTS